MPFIVYPNKYVLKTCGTTRLLNSVPKLLELAAQIGMEPSRCKFSRATFLFPEHQHFPHTSFDDEVQFLDEQFNEPLNRSGRAYVLGQPHQGLQWHVYVAGVPRSDRPTFNLEICMTELGEEAALQFVRTEKFVSAEQTTRDSGILGIKPAALIDDYVFEPCGYSMNGIEGTGLMTIHITPEPGFSYASLEVSGHAEDVSCPNELLAKALAIFEPGKVSMALSVDQADQVDQTLATLNKMVPSGYSRVGALSQRLECGGAVSFYNLDREGKEPSTPSSPGSFLHAGSSLSFGTMGSVASMEASDMMDGNSSDEFDVTRAL